MLAKAFAPSVTTFIKRNVALLLAIAVFLIFLIPIFVGTAWALLIGPTGNVWLGVFPWILINIMVELPAALVCWGLYKKSRVGYVAAGIVVPLYFLAMLPQLWTVEAIVAILVGVAMLVYYWRLAITKKKAKPATGAADPLHNVPTTKGDFLKRTNIEKVCIGLAALFALIPAGAVIVAFVLMVIGDKYGRWGNIEGVPFLLLFVLLIALPPALVILWMLKRSWIAYVLAGLVVATWFTGTFGNVPGLVLSGAAGKTEQTVVVVVGLAIIALYWWAAFRLKTSPSFKKS